MNLQPKRLKYMLCWLKYLELCFVLFVVFDSDSDFSCAEQCFLCVIITYLSMIGEEVSWSSSRRANLSFWSILSCFNDDLLWWRLFARALWTSWSQSRVIAEWWTSSWQCILWMWARSHDEIKYGAISVVLNIKNITAVTMAAIGRMAYDRGSWSLLIGHRHNGCCDSEFPLFFSVGFWFWLWDATSL